MKTPLPWYLAPIGRILLAAIFLASAVGKFQSWQGTVQMMTDKGLQYPDVLLSLAVMLELVGGASVLVGLYARLGAIALLGFLIPVSIIMHGFWGIEDPQAHQMQMIQFMKNLSIMGGIVLVLAYGAGPISLDAWTKMPRPTTPVPPEPPRFG